MNGSLRSKMLSPTNGKGGLASAGSLFPLEGIPAGHVTLAQLVHWFPAVPAPLLVTLAIMAMCDDRVTPFRLCACGCGAPVHGKAVLAFVACRKRIQRERDAQRRGAPKQFNLV